MKFDYFKYHGLGNDYIVIDPQNADISLEPEIIRLICHRNFGVGSDGILYGPIIKGEDLQLRIFNPDGSEAEKSGNGIRIFSRYLFDAGYLHSNQFQLETLGGRVYVELLDATAGEIRVDMGTVTFFSAEVPVSGPPRQVINEELTINGRSFNVTCLSIGNPHCVVLLDDISRELVEEIGPIIENHALFPNRINVQLLKVLDRNNIQIEIWERGAGYTLASGSSSCATASAAYKLGLVAEDINVHMPGGAINVKIGQDGHVRMTGSVTAVCKGVFMDDLAAQIRDLSGL
ncbi:diaminopimelate epimerase [Anaerosporomusa subterranea]|uniref:Diaminopimelate epimerase n=1 Tax=Anaerosporomusa subterranea TaxID=1794912 RepID=A0A154BQ60_ANASB|nr:diaminopimelate epimerase [Anaerosporomusa subterranea]KYZ76076.1 diaminopimelate epimerase [Anaerosporomusa subterranea]